MRRGALALALAALLAAPAAAGVSDGSRLARPLLAAGDVPRLWLAQRTIERHWGPSDDSTYVTVNVPDWKSEGWAMALSGAAPGAGQLYVGAGSGWWYLLGEAGGWAGRWLYRREANRYRGQAAARLGDPYDSTSAWSFQRFQARGGGDVSWLQTLWADDREGFYNAIQRGGYTAGFSGGGPFRSWVDLRLSADNAFRREREMDALLVLNHVLSAFDALRAARIHNLPLQPNLRLQLGERWNRGGPALRAALVESF
ncbi:MAG TPA: hypothetical protein VGU27_12065 [Candidatus Eisenbacteria bacterium]|nr:hypothetical protein [Candidatus Eisenbacteria bacterium]